MTSMAQLARHHRCLVWNADSGLLLWEIARKTPEGVTCGVCKTEKGMQILEQYGRTLGSLDRPILKARGQSISTDFLTPKDFYNLILDFQYSGTVFDRIFFTDPFSSEPAIIALAESLQGILSPKPDEDENVAIESPLAEGFKIIISQKIPCHGQHISELVRKQILTPQSLEPFRSILDKMEEAEQEFFGDRENPLFSWDGLFIANMFRKKDFAVKVASQEIKEKRRITPGEIEKWFSSESSAYGSKIYQALGGTDLQKIVNLLLAACNETVFEWKSEISFLTITSESVN